MMWGVPTDLILDALVAVLLCATIFYCALLDRRLKALRSGQDGFKEIIDQLNTATARAEMSIGQLKQASTNVGSGLVDQLGKARAATDELSVMVASGNNLAERLVEDRDAERGRFVAEKIPAPVSRDSVVSFGSDSVTNAKMPVREIETGLNHSLLEALKKAR